MNNYHQQLLEKIKQSAKNKTSWENTYLGHEHFHYQVINPVLRQIAKEFLKANPKISQSDLKNLSDSLYQGQSYEEKTITGYLLEYAPILRKNVTPKDLDKWLVNLTGWAEVDSLCQNKFKADEMLNVWLQWETLLKEFAQSENIQKRRASLVLLTGPVGNLRDHRLKILAFENIDQLKNERDILITKAISWLLRSLTRHYKEEVLDYVNRNLNTLPKIATRETLRKIKTGKK